MRTRIWKRSILIMIPLLVLSLTHIAGAASVGRMIDDSTITTEVKSKMMAEKEFPASKVHVETQNGTVILSGHVDRSVEKRRAAEIARSVDGVKKVENDLKVSS